MRKSVFCTVDFEDDVSPAVHHKKKIKLIFYTLSEITLKLKFKEKIPASLTRMVLSSRSVARGTDRIRRMFHLGRMSMTLLASTVADFSTF